MLHFFTFTLVVFRLSGLMTTTPVFSSPNVPLNLRILLVVALSFLLTPMLPNFAKQGFQRLDRNGDGRLQRSEVPDQLQPRVDDLLARKGNPPDESLTWREYQGELHFPKSVLDYLWIAVCEFGLGLVLGVGTTIVLSALQLAGQMIDQQTGISLGEVFNPDLDTDGSLTGTTLYVFGTMLFLVVGGHLLVVSALIETFQTLPLGAALVSQSSIDLLIKLVHQSLVLSFQISAPLLATMSVLALGMGFLGHTVPQINILVFGFPIRVLTGLFVMALAMSGIGDLIADSVPAAIDHLREALTGLPAN